MALVRRNEPVIRQLSSELHLTLCITLCRYTEKQGMAFLPGPAGPKERQKEHRVIHRYQGKTSCKTQRCRAICTPLTAVEIFHPSPGSQQYRPARDHPGRSKRMYYMQTHLTSNTQRSEPTDDILIRQAHVGDQDAFEMLVNRYSALLFLLISRIVRDEHLAHDVLQHVFLQLYRSLPTPVPGGDAQGMVKPGSTSPLSR